MVSGFSPPDRRFERTIFCLSGIRKDTPESSDGASEAQHSLLFLFYYRERDDDTRVSSRYKLLMRANPRCWIAISQSAKYVPNENNSKTLHICPTRKFDLDPSRQTLFPLLVFPESASAFPQAVLRLQQSAPVRVPPNSLHDTAQSA